MLFYNLINVFKKQKNMTSIKMTRLFELFHI